MTLLRRTIAGMPPYVPGEQPQDGGYIKLNTNESPYPPSEAVMRALAGFDAVRLRLYPDPDARALVSAAARAFGVLEASVLAGNGSDELLSMILRAFVDPGETVAYPFPTYVLYRTLAQIAGALVTELSWCEDYALPKGIERTPAKALFLCNPNSPSGTFVGAEEVRKLARAFRGLLVVDEAYVDFADPACGAAMELTGEFDNVMVLRTVSKSYSLAGLRLGFAVAAPELIAGMRKVKDSYNVSRLAQALGEAALRDPATREANVARIRATRARLTEGLRRLAFHVYPSQANFVWARHGRIEPKRLYEELKARRILVRVFSTKGMTDHVRISVGTDDEIDKMLAATREIVGA